MSKTWNWGIIGPGKIAHKFAQDIAKLDNARLSAVASRSQDRADQFARQYGAPYAYDSYEALLKCPELDVVYIATPHSEHYRNTMACIEAGIPVLCEKAFAFNTTEAREMAALAQRKEVFLMEALWTRFLPTTQKILELIQSDAIGRVVSVKADFGFKADYNPQSRLFNPELAGGALLDIGIYPVFIAYLMMGRPERVHAIARMGQTGVDEELGVLFQMGDGRMAHLHATLLAHTKTEAFIYGEKGTIHIHTRWHEPTHFSLIGEDRRPQNFHFDYDTNGYSYEAQEVMRCLNEGLTESPLWPLSRTLELMETLDRIRAEIGLVYPGEHQ
ncbi:MAG: Gfo/Idh/MocA family protein [Phaeodactylibacter xiamenensis]|uniref:Oxidoreductase n=1 Tax=Phaeodactylibacter xiamenensis TaxID=1524460 RepID=A0A098SDA9_9BACT|nr:Gfo/Idh/MocA family oxidoreductase [Phaeodactylibacter xiamenensis]KGE89628.1 oxidoreductase [Phaeodactylibacter xiamenensis]MCR9053504.1 Gfo/Idh/MocA family oxidoreductase [bacterium]